MHLVILKIILFLIARLLSASEPCNFTQEEVTAQKQSWGVDYQNEQRNKIKIFLGSVDKSEEKPTRPCKEIEEHIPDTTDESQSSNTSSVEIKNESSVDSAAKPSALIYVYFSVNWLFCIIFKGFYL